jgi:hypothetical protein
VASVATACGTCWLRLKMQQLTVLVVCCVLHSPAVLPPNFLFCSGLGLILWCLIYCGVWYIVLSDILWCLIYCGVWYIVLSDILWCLIYCGVWYIVVSNILCCLKYPSDSVTWRGVTWRIVTWRDVSWQVVTYRASSLAVNIMYFLATRLDTNFVARPVAGHVFHVKRIGLIIELRCVMWLIVWQTAIYFVAFYKKRPWPISS